MITDLTLQEPRLPEGVVQIGQRFKVRINTKHGYRIVGEFETPDEAHAAFLETRRPKGNR